MKSERLGLRRRGTPLDGAICIGKCNGPTGHWSAITTPTLTYLAGGHGPHLAAAYACPPPPCPELTRLPPQEVAPLGWGAFLGPVVARRLNRRLTLRYGSNWPAKPFASSTSCRTK